MAVDKNDTQATTSKEIRDSLSRLGSWKESEVETAKLSLYVKEPVNFLKLDIEGAETEVLQELNKSLKVDPVKEGALKYHFSKHNKDNYPLSFFVYQKRVILPSRSQITCYHQEMKMTLQLLSNFFGAINDKTNHHVF